MKRTAKMLTAALLALALALPGTAAAADDTPAVRISEMMYKNHATLQDADGDFSDWFELENTSNRVVRLKGWSVSDGKTVWDFPADATIPRGGVRVVFASRKDKTAAGESHTSFALGEGVTLYLIAPGGTIADRAACDPELPADHVLRRENGGELTESVWATPGYPNTAAGYAAFCESRKTESPLVIYEAAVYNDTFALKGEYYDWVEIKNVSKESVKLSDYCLSDDRRELEKWSLPNRTLAKGQSILIYCTGEENPTTGNGLRANFALNASSETLYLTKKGESAAADFVWLHDIPYGYSMGRTDAENGFFYLRKQTPNEPNKTDAYRYISEAPAANRESGVFEAGQTVRVKLAAAGDIYYTTDGSAPTEESTPYTGAITVDKTTVLRAAAVEEGGAPSRALTLSFFIGEEHTLPVLSLVTDSPRRFSETYNGAVKYRECAANLSLLAPEGGFSIDCGVELKGRTSLFNPKKSLGVSFRGCYGAETLQYDIFGEGPAEFTELSIRAGQDYISTVFRNELMQELCAELDTTVTQRSRYCVLYINGEYWGIYCLKDDITRQFYANLTGTAKEDVTMLPSPVAQNTAVYTEALGLWRDTSLTRREAYERFCEAIAVDAHTLVVMPQIHSAEVRVVDRTMGGHGIYTPPVFECDALVTDSAGTALGVRVADCVPILLADPGAKVIAAVHAGWRGTVGDIVGKAVRKMCYLGASAEDIRAAIGPHISMANYEVGEEVARAVLEVVGEENLTLRHLRPAAESGKFLCGLGAVNETLLLRAGLRPEHIDLSDACTYADAELFYSHRRMGDKRGTMMAVIAI